MSETKTVLSTSTASSYLHMSADAPCFVQHSINALLLHCCVRNCFLDISQTGIRLFLDRGWGVLVLLSVCFLSVRLFSVCFFSVYLLAICLFSIGLAVHIVVIFVFQFLWKQQTFTLSRSGRTVSTPGRGCLLPFISVWRPTYSTPLRQTATDMQLLQLPRTDF